MENTNSLNITSNKLFPIHFQFVGLLILIIGILVAIVYSPLKALAFFLIGLVILTGSQGVEFQKDNKRYREWNSILFLKFGKWELLNPVEKIFINASKVSQKFNSAMANTGSSFKHIEYNAYLKFERGTKIFLKSNKNKEKLMKQMMELTQFFGLDVIDNTVS